MTRPLALMFPGQGAQHVGMAAGLYGSCPSFTATMDTAFRLLGDRGPRIRDLWLGRRRPEPPEMFDDITCAQPLLYAVGCALGGAVIDHGTTPAALVGHSVGELVAATLAGVLDFADGLALMGDRIGALADEPVGAMLAVAAPAEELSPYLRGDVAIAAVNAPRQVLVAGPAGEVAEVERELRAAGHTCRPARSRQAFHSPALAAAVELSVPAWKRVELRPPRLAVYSARLGSLMTPDRAVDPVFWARQPAEPVLFWSALDALLSDRDVLLVEAGPGQGLSTIARRHPAVARGDSAVVPLLPTGTRGPADTETARAAAERIRADGHACRCADSETPGLHPEMDTECIPAAHDASPTAH